MTNKKRGLMQLRAEIGVDQTALAKEARMSQSMISLLELGKRPIKEATAWQLFYAINRLRVRRDFPEITFEEFEW